jgi:hypothetical protein
MQPVPFAAIERSFSSKASTMPYGVYKIIHLTGIIMTFLALGGAALHGMNGGGENKSRKFASAMHGIGLTLALVGGFGLLARLNMSFPWGGWVFVKLGIWLVLGGIISVFLRKPEVSKPMWFVLVGLFAVAAFMAQYKPF